MPGGDDSQILLQSRGVTRVFPGVVVLDGVDFEFRRGEIHALLGENGAGKSTLIKVLTGVYRRSGGEILLEGRPIDPASTLERSRWGSAPSIRKSISSRSFR